MVILFFASFAAEILKNTAHKRIIELV